MLPEAKIKWSLTKKRGEDASLLAEEGRVRGGGVVRGKGRGKWIYLVPLLRIFHLTATRQETGLGEK